MKRLIITLISFIMLAGVAFAGNVDLEAAWEQSNYFRVDRWVISYSTISGGPYLEIGTLTKAEAEADGVTKEFILGSPDGEKIMYYFVVRAYDDTFVTESGYSNQAEFEVDFSVVDDPTQLTIIIKISSP